MSGAASCLSWNSVVACPRSLARVPSSLLKTTLHITFNTSLVLLQVHWSIGLYIQSRSIIVQLLRMLLKRKRSDSEISNSSSSILSSPPPLNAMEISSSFPSISPFLRDTNVPHLSSRTRKRFRDNRPSEAKIHGKPSAIEGFWALPS